LIKVDNLSKNYDDVKAVKSISFELQDGQVVGFLGANGAGKSTTLKIMTGISHLHQATFIMEIETYKMTHRIYKKT